MSTAVEQSLTGAPEDGLKGLTLDAPGQPQAVPGHSEQLLTANQSSRRELASCFHCGEPCPEPGLTKDDKAFCCRGCLFVHDLLAESGLGQF